MYYCPILYTWLGRGWKVTQALDWPSQASQCNRETKCVHNYRKDKVSQWSQQEDNAHSGVIRDGSMDKRLLD